ncbi:VOC family protein [Dickeya lacustris]|uniref:VOC family protein n=1 Tax=Dickeya lacustris TaxID=2259638 RepID=A0ABY8GA55_9GAMM|nr:VOC family protein [Dickeya lacustris]WFN56820.1 VOC family protein [Dickeya lacustris]
MLEQLSIPVSDLRRSLHFYQQALQPLGYEHVKDMKFAVSFALLSGDGLAASSGVTFWLFQGEVCRPAALHIAFSAPSKAAVDAFFSAALAAGGVENAISGKPVASHPGEYAAFVRDPDGYTVAVMCRPGMRGERRCCPMRFSWQGVDYPPPASPLVLVS